MPPSFSSSLGIPAGQGLGDFLSLSDTPTLRQKYYDALQGGLDAATQDQQLPQGQLLFQGIIPALATALLTKGGSLAQSGAPLMGVLSNAQKDAADNQKLTVEAKLKGAGLLGDELGKREALATTIANKEEDRAQKADLAQKHNEVMTALLTQRMNQSDVNNQRNNNSRMYATDENNAQKYYSTDANVDVRKRGQNMTYDTNQQREQGLNDRADQATDYKYASLDERSREFNISDETKKHIAGMTIEQRDRALQNLREIADLKDATTNRIADQNSADRHYATDVGANTAAAGIDSREKIAQNSLDAENARFAQTQGTKSVDTTKNEAQGYAKSIQDDFQKRNFPNSYNNVTAAETALNKLKAGDGLAGQAVKDSLVKFYTGSSRGATYLVKTFVPPTLQGKAADALQWLTSSNDNTIPPSQVAGLEALVEAAKADTNDQFNAVLAAHRARAGVEFPNATTSGAIDVEQKAASQSYPGLVSDDTMFKPPKGPPLSFGQLKKIPGFNMNLLNQFQRVE